jgi:histone H3/H4
MIEGSDYAQELSKQAVARAALALGIKAVDKVAIDALADVIRQYISTVAVSSRNQAEFAGRAFPGIHDVFKALESTVRLGFDCCRAYDLR